MRFKLCLTDLDNLKIKSFSILERDPTRVLFITQEIPISEQTTLFVTRNTKLSFNILKIYNIKAYDKEGITVGFIFQVPKVLKYDTSFMVGSRYSITIIPKKGSLSLRYKTKDFGVYLSEEEELALIVRRFESLPVIEKLCDFPV